MRLTSAQGALLRQRPQQTKLYLSIFQPQIVFQARINNGSAARGDRVIPYDTVSLGSFTAIRAGATMWIGTTAGAMDVGKIRTRSATASNITVSENSNIDWADDLFLTVFYYFELWPVFPRIIQDPSNAENVLFYKDYDIPYTNQNSILGTFINMGPHRAANLDPASGQAQEYFSSTGTYNLLGNSLNYNWQFQGGTPSSSSLANPGYVSWDTPGQYVVSLTVSGSNGAIDTSYRYVSMYNPANPPIQKWQLTSLNGTRDEGGYTASFKVFEDIPIQEHAVVVIYGDNWYGSTKQSLGGNYPNASDIFWVGYVDTDSIIYDYLHSEITFNAHSITGMMKESSGFSVSVESKASPSKWYELLDMDCRRAIYHYLRWHTTALNIADFQFGGDDRKIQFFDADRESMYDAIDNLMRGTLWGKVVSDRQGKVWMEVNPEGYEVPTDNFTPVMTISKRDWMNEPSITERLSEEVAFIEMGGIAYSGTVTGTFSALLGSAPGNAPGFHGGQETIEGLALLGQDQLNHLVGNVLANKNSPFPTIEQELGVNASNLDIAPLETVNQNISASDTVRELAIDGLYLVEGMGWTYSPQDFLLLPKVTFKELVDGETGETIIVQVPEEIENGYSVPGFSIPPIPPFTVPAYSIPSGTISAIVAAATTQDYASYIVTASGPSSANRGITINSVVLTDSLSSANFILSRFGVYFVSAYWLQFTTGATPGDSAIEGDMQINNSSGQDLRVRAIGIADLAGAAQVNGSLSGVISAGGTIQFVLTTTGSGTIGVPLYLGFSVVRVSD